jgi:hypothetical protein
LIEAMLLELRVAREECLKQTTAMNVSTRIIVPVYHFAIASGA